MENERKTIFRVGFTLLELLVVVAVLALLVSLLMPSLKMARGLAQSAVCQTHLRQIGLCEEFYASDCDGWRIPGAMSWNWSNSFPNDWYHYITHPQYGYLPGYDGWGQNWFSRPNDKNRDVLACPSHTKLEATIGPWGVGISYFYNAVPTGAWSSLRLSDLRRPAETIFVSEKRTGSMGDSARAHAVTGSGNGSVENALYGRHGPGDDPLFNSVFDDGHTEPLNFEDTWDNLFLPAANGGGLYWRKVP